MTLDAQRLVWVVATAGLLIGFLVLDAHRGGPATLLTRCSLALARSGAPAADVLVIGSSRTGTAIDPVAMEDMLGDQPGLGRPTVERIALPRSPLRANVALLETYLTERGRPRVIALEISFVTPRSLERIEDLGPGLGSEAYLFQRDMNLMRYHQILAMATVAMPISEEETAVNRARYRLRGAVFRTGALAYQFARDPEADFSLDECDVATSTREPTWPADFAFSWDGATEVGPPSERIESLRAEISAGGSRADGSSDRGPPADRHYPYDVDEPYREGELALLDTAIGLAADRGIPVVLLPLTLADSRPSDADLRSLEARYGNDAHPYDLYGATGVDLSASWYDDAHLEVATAGQLTTTLLTQHLIGVLTDRDRVWPPPGPSPISAAPPGE